LIRANLRRTLLIAAIVGLFVTCVNQGDVLLSGKATALTYIKIVLNFCVPFVVSNLGVLAGQRDQAVADALGN
jgi:hypothetical protein